MNNIQSLLHATVLVSDLQRSLAFYCDLLRLPRDESRPDLGFPGVWLQLGEQQLHLMELPSPDPVDGRPEHGGRDRHLAMSVLNLDGLAAQLDHAGIGYSRSKSGRRALFCRDPDGNALEFIQAP